MKKLFLLCFFTIISFFQTAQGVWTPPPRIPIHYDTLNMQFIEVQKPMPVEFHNEKPLKVAPEIPDNMLDKAIKNGIEQLNETLEDNALTIKNQGKH